MIKADEREFRARMRRLNENLEHQMVLESRVEAAKAAFVAFAGVALAVALAAAVGRRRCRK